MSREDVEQRLTEMASWHESYVRRLRPDDSIPRAIRRSDGIDIAGRILMSDSIEAIHFALEVLSQSTTTHQAKATLTELLNRMVYDCEDAGGNKNVSIVR